MRWMKKSFFHILMILLVLVVAAAIFIYRDKVAELGNYGYLGAFLISVTSSATIIMPVPGMLLIVAFGDVLNPVLVGLVAAVGATIGEATGYMLGHSGRRLITSNKIFTKTERWTRRWGAMTIFVFALVPLLPIDIVGIVAGSLHFPLWKFFLACLFGKALLYIGMAFNGAWGLEIGLQYLSW